MIRTLYSIFRDSANSFEGQERDEKVVLLLRQHPFVILIRLGLLGLAGLIPIIFGIMFLPYLSAYGWLNLFFFVSSVWFLGLWLIVFYLLTIYTLNTVIITDRRIIDSDQQGFFNRKISELLYRRIQDVSMHTSGVIETFLQFGNVTVQTAASEKQFIFHRVPKPEKVKDVIRRLAAARNSGVKAIT